MLPMFFFSLWCFGQASTIRGTVKDENGTTLPGVSVVAKETNTVAITDANGNYTIATPAGAKTLKFSFVGMASQEINIEGKTQIDVVLAEDIIGLGEIVVVGYGTQRKEAVTGSVSTVKGEMLSEVPAANISRALQGRVAGVDMSQTSTKPGSDMQIRIRGTRSLTADNNPLVVLDGIPFSGTIGDINPNDIKSVDILKDASATAIYGSRGANGVILVTTNKGSKGQKAKITYNGYQGIKKAIKFPMMNGAEFTALRAAAKANGSAYANTIDEIDGTNTDWQDLLYRTGEVSSHDLGVAGGTEKGNYNFGIGYYKDQGVIPLQNYTRISQRASLDQEIGEYIRVGFSTNNNYAITNGDNLGPGSALNASPLASPYNEDGTWKTTYLMQTAGAQWIYTRHSLEALGDKYINQTKALSTYNSMYAEVKIPGVEGLKYRTNVGLNYRQANNGQYTGQGVFSGTPTTISTASTSNYLTLNWAVENMLTYDRTFAEKHRINAVAMFSSEQTTYNRSTIAATDIPSDAFQFYNLGRANKEIKVNPSDQDYNQTGLMSKMGRVMYSYDDRYMVSATLRQDGSSRLAPGHKYHTYPALSGGWNIKKEKFMDNVSFLDALKLRVGYGETSNQAVNPYKTLGLLNTKPVNFGSSDYQTGLYVSELPNATLGWEYSKTMNYGIDFGFLHNRITGTIEYYEMNTSNVLLSVSLPVTSGANNYMSNVGKTQNKGIEFSLNGTILDNYNGFTWDVGVNLSANKNKLVSLASGQQKDEGNLFFVGHSINSIYDYKKVGIWQKDDLYQSILEPGTKPGIIKVQYTGDYNADGTPTRKINADDRQIIDVDPDFVGGFNSRLAYKGFELSVIGTFQHGGTLNSALYGSGSYLNNLNSRSNNNVKVDYWTETNTGAKYPAPGGAGGDNPKYGSTLGYFDASFLRIRTITLAYNFTQKWMTSTGIDKLRVYCTVENPFVFFSPYHTESGLDPEPNSYGDQNLAVGGVRRMLVVGTNSPSTHNYLVGINLTF
jgi:TonB-linked SusC/RagA family outer membrane protein